jgi:hypothetical protein
MAVANAGDGENAIVALNDADRSNGIACLRQNRAGKHGFIQATNIARRQNVPSRWARQLRARLPVM